MMDRMKSVLAWLRTPLVGQLAGVFIAGSGACALFGHPLLTVGIPIGIAVMYIRMHMRERKISN